MMVKFTGKIVLVTGGSRGIGKGVALKLAHEGASIAINYHKNVAQAQVVMINTKATFPSQSASS